MQRGRSSRHVVSLSDEAPRLFGPPGELCEKGLTRIYVVSLMHGGVLRSGVEVAQTPLQW